VSEIAFVEALKTKPPTWKLPEVSGKSGLVMEILLKIPVVPITA
jgi:hypothetical protein